MNQHILLNTVLALFIPSIAGFPVVPGLAQAQPPVPSIQNQQVSIPHSSTTSITFRRPVIFNTLDVKSLPNTAFVSQPFLISSGVGAVAPAEVDCNNASSDAMVPTSEELRSVGIYCQTQSGNFQQPAPNIQTTLQHPWQTPYWLNGNLCRERGADLVCLTPQEASKLRWLIPLKQQNNNT